MGLGALAGKPSKVGFYIESAHKTVPITTAGGAANTLGIAATNPGRFFIVSGGGMGGDPEIEFPEGEMDGSRERKRSIYIAHGPNGTYPGQFPFLGDGETLYYPLLGTMGNDVQTQLAASATGQAPFKHVFKFDQNYRPSFTCEEILGDATVGRVTAGCVFPGLDFSLGKILSMALSSLGYGQVPNMYVAAGVETTYDFTSSQTVIPGQLGGDGTKTWARTASPVYVDVAQGNSGNGPFTFAQIQYGNESGFSSHYMLRNGAAYVSGDAKVLEGGRISLANNISPYMTTGSGYEAGQCVLNDHKVSGVFPTFFINNEQLIGTRNHDKFSLNMMYRGPQIGSSGFYYDLEFHIPHLKFTTPPPTLQNSALMLDGKWDAIYDATAGYSVKITLTNTTSNALLGGVAPLSGDGGLGGFTKT